MEVPSLKPSDLKINAMSLNKTRLSFIRFIKVSLLLSLLFTLPCASLPGKEGRKINLSKRGLTEIPEWVFLSPESVRVLNLFGNHLTEIDPRIGELKNLEKLYVGRNDLKTLPPEIGRLKKLELLSAQYNEIDTLPPEIGELESLEQLWLTQNELNYLPAELMELKRLSVLKLNFNQLLALPENIGNCERLGFIYLNKNHLTRIPESISKLSHLKEMYLAKAGALLALPESICDLRYMEILEVDRGTVLPTCLLVIRANRLQIIMR